ncbi:MAG TPA: Gfo/Idh/MocA family oxidoreductase [Allosphingosinicella sp.]|jgi:predicted dehydrogenase
MVRWGMIGCGAVTERKSAPAYAQAAGSRLVAVASRRPEAARAYAGRRGIGLVFDDPDALIRSPEVDAVYIATPPSSHRALAAKVAAAGKPCCVEKPIALSHAEAAAMVDAFRAAGQPLFVAYYRRSLPRFAQVRRWIAEGAIGEVRHVHWALARAPTPGDLSGDPGWRADPAEAPGGYFEDLACHGLDLFDFLLGPIDEAAGIHRNRAGLYAVPDSVAAAWSHSGGATGSGFWTFAACRVEDEVRLLGSEGRISFSVFEEAPLVLETGAGGRTVEIPNPDPIQLHHVENMIRHLSGEAPHPSTGESAARTAWVTDRIFARTAG